MSKINLRFSVVLYFQIVNLLILFQLYVLSLTMKYFLLMEEKKKINKNISFLKL